jgi:ketosteroid isomerase-like protein
MSEDNVEVVRRAVGAVIRRPKPDFSTMNDLYHPDHEFISLVDAIEGGKHRGGRGYRDWLLNTQDAVEWTQTLEQATEIDKERVLVITPTRFRGRSSGVALKEQRLGWVVTVRGGKIIRTEVHPTPEEVLKVAGLEE